MSLLMDFYKKKTMSFSEAYQLMVDIAEGAVPAEQISALLAVMHFRGETSEEIAGFAKAILSMSKDLSIKSMKLLDVCGTGGDGSGTFNISTATALLLSACGVNVAKHGNRAVSSQCGSADVLEEMGIEIELSQSLSSLQLKQEGFSFFFAPKYHQAFAGVGAVRKKINARTVFNVLGPLVNPLQPDFQLVGVFSSAYVERMAEALRLLGRKRAIVVAARDGLDEFSVCSESDYAFLNDGKIQLKSVSPEELGFVRRKVEDLQGGDRLVNAQIISQVLSGDQGAATDAVLMNSAAGLLVSGEVSTLIEGVERARAVQSSGAGYRKIEKLKSYSKIGGGHA